jgi:hypothetical protein
MRAVRQRNGILGLIAVVGLAAPATASAAPAWLEPVDVSRPDLTANAGDVAIDAAGETVVAWGRFGGATTPYRVQVAMRPPGGTFSAPADLSADGDFVDPPRLAMNQAGDAVLVWDRTSGGPYGVQAAVRPAGGSFSVPPRNLSTPGQFSNAPQVAIDERGDAVVVWATNGSKVLAVTRPAGGSFSTPVEVSGAGAFDKPQVAIGAAGDIAVVWQRANGYDGPIQAAVRPAGGSFSTPVELAPSGQSGFDPQVAVDQAGNALVVWRSTGTAQSVQAALRPAGGTFSAALTLATAPQIRSGPQVAVDAAGEAAVVWSRQDDPPGATVQAAVRPAGGFFSTAVVLSGPPSGGSALDPQVAIDRAGNTYAVWQRNSVVQAAVRPAGGSFSTAVDLSDGGQNAAKPQVAASDSGDAVAVWQRSNGVRDVLQTAGYSRSGPLLAGLNVPASAIVGTPVGFSVSPFVVWSEVAATSWSFGDTGSASGTNVSHAFANTGDYAVTVTSTSTVGNASSATRTISVAPPPPPPPGPCTDCDGDRYPASVDCKDHDPAIHPGAVDKPGNRIDEDCSGRDASYPRVGSGIVYGMSYCFAAKRSADCARKPQGYWRFTKLRLEPALAGSTVRLSCTGGGCPFKTTTLKVTKNAAGRSLMRLVRRARLRDARFEIRITKPATIGYANRITVRKRRPDPTSTVRCLEPGAKAPARC